MSEAPERIEMLYWKDEGSLWYYPEGTPEPTEDEELVVYVQESRLARLREALQRISNHESRSDRRHRGMVDVSEVDDLQRIARRALAVEGELK